MVGAGGNFVGGAPSTKLTAVDPDALSPQYEPPQLANYEPLLRPRDTHFSAELTAPAASHASWRTRPPWIPIAISAAVLIASVFAVPPVRDAATLQGVSEAYLAQPFGYVALAPLSNMLDTITLLSARQHIAVVLGLLVMWTAWRFARPRRIRRGWRRDVTSLAVLLVCIVSTYAAAVFLPRPMAHLASHDADILRIDFHSHTASSRDARQAFSVEDNRAWHREGGYNAAYVTDHATVAAAALGVAHSPAGAEDVVLLQGIEVNWVGEHVGILGAERTHRGLLTANLRNVDPPRLATASAVRTHEPIVIWHHARVLNSLPFARGATIAGVRAMEISNGGSDAMDRARSNRQQIVALAKRYRLALTTGSDNHGWGYTAPNWTLIRLANWRGLKHDDLAARIERAICDGGFDGTRAVERVTADPESSAVTLAFSVVGVPWCMLTTLSTEERLMWLVWTWAIAGAVLWRRRRRAATS